MARRQLKFTRMVQAREEVQTMSMTLILTILTNICLENASLHPPLEYSSKEVVRPVFDFVAACLEIIAATSCRVPRILCDRHKKFRSCSAEGRVSPLCSTVFNSNMEIQKHRNTETWKYRNTEIWKYRNT